MTIPSLLKEIADLLVMCHHDQGEPDRLRAWAADLSRSLPTSEAQRTLVEVQKSLAGMGSLSDIYLFPPASAGITASDANLRLFSLVNALDHLLRQHQSSIL